MTVLDAMPWEIAAQAFEPRPRRWSTPGELAQALDPRMIQTPALELIDQALVDLADGIDSRIAIFMSPQEGKSERCSHYFPLWMLQQNPDLRCAVVSHSQDLAYNWGWLLRQDISTFDGEHHEIDLGLRLHERPAQGHWRIRDHHGGIYCTGVSGSLSGRPVDCLRGGTPVLTEYGYARIEDLHHRRTNTVRVASFNHRTGLVEWRRIVASRAIPDRPLVEVVTASGRRITCTPDHRIYSADRAYVPAAELRPGERLVAADAGAGEVPQLRDADRAVSVVHREPEAGRAAGPDGSHGTRRPLPAQVTARGTSHQRAASGQPAGEPDRDLPAMPYDPPQVGYDTVSVVRELRGTRDTVYDLQVEGNRNFFAGEVLVHNCLILDDPIKDLEQANSIRYRERAWRFWQAVAIPRMGPHTKVVLMTTRWHEDDIAGRILAAEGDKAKGGKWRVISIPARCEDERSDPLGRREGEYQISARGRTQEQWREREKDSGAYVWSALFQQRPSPAEGGVFKRLWWRYWTPAGENRIDLGGRIADLRDAWKFGTVDLAASTSTSADYTVIAAWARTLSGDLVLLDRLRAKIGEEKHFEHARGLVEQWQLDTLFVEKSQQGYTLVKEATQAGVPISPLTAEQDKLTRALPASAWCSGGRIWLPASAWWLDEFRSEAAGFPAGAHDDQVDVLAYAVRVAITQWVPLVNRAQQATARPEPEPDPFGGQSGVDDWDQRTF